MSLDSASRRDIIDLAYTLKAASHELTRRLNLAFKPLGITCVQADVLLALGQHGPLSLKELSTKIVAESGNPSRLVDRMSEAGLVARERDADDRRLLIITLTDAGEALLARVQVAREPLITVTAESIDLGELRQTLAFLRRYALGPG
jgi:DNA-binding MarR family transcriptional regulator